MISPASVVVFNPPWAVKTVIESSVRVSQSADPCGCSITLIRTILSFRRRQCHRTHSQYRGCETHRRAMRNLGCTEMKDHSDRWLAIGRGMNFAERRLMHVMWSPSWRSWRLRKMELPDALYCRPGPRLLRHCQVAANTYNVPI